MTTYALEPPGPLRRSVRARLRRGHDGASAPPQPRSAELVLQIADCTNTINLEFSVETAQLRENSLFKVETLIGALHRFRDGLAAEAELAAQRDSRPNERRCAMTYLKRHGTRRVPQWVPLPGQAANSAGGLAWAVDAGRGCAASSCSAPRAAPTTRPSGR